MTLARDPAARVSVVRRLICRPRFLTGLSIVGVLVVVAAGGWLLVDDYDRPQATDDGPQDVTFAQYQRLPPEIGTFTQREALARASKVVGFDLRAPSYLPQGWRLDSVILPSAKQLTLGKQAARAWIRLTNGVWTFDVEERGQKLSGANWTREVDLGSSRGRLLVAENPAGTDYLFYVNERAYVVSIGHLLDLPMAEAELVRMLASIPPE